MTQKNQRTRQLARAAQIRRQGDAAKSVKRSSNPASDPGSSTSSTDKPSLRELTDRAAAEARTRVRRA
jgi:hypothetical protein